MLNQASMRGGAAHLEQPGCLVRLEAQQHKALLLQVCVVQQVPGTLPGSHAAQPLARQHW